MKLLLLVMTITFISCSQNHQFDNDPKNTTSQSRTEGQSSNLEPSSARQTSNQPIEVVSADITKEPMIFTQAQLIVEPSSFSVKSGGEPIIFRARIEGQSFSPNVQYAIVGNGAKKLGSIDRRGVYTIPENVPVMTNIEITANLKSDPSITANTTGIVSPKDALFIPCKADDQNQTIVAGLYYLPEDTDSLPNFANLTQQATVCLDQLAIASRSFSEGFPGVSDRFEWFGLTIRTKLKVPQSGKITLAINSDDGSKVYLDNTLIIDNDGIHPPQLKTAEIELTKGVHDLAIDYFQGPRFFLALQLMWQLPGQNNMEIIGKQFFSHPDK